MDHSAFIYSPWEWDAEAWVETKLLLPVCLCFVPLLCGRGGDRAEGTGLPAGPGRAELGQVRGARPERAACHQGQHDGPEPAEQPGDHRGQVLHKPAQQDD